MTFLERHEVLVLALIVATMILGMGLVGLYLCVKSGNYGQAGLDVSGTITGLAAVKGATTFAAVSPNSVFGSGQPANPPAPSAFSFASPPPAQPPPGGPHA